MREDLGINPIVQKGMASGAYRPGRYSLEEYIVHRIANRVLDRVIGPDDAHHGRCAKAPMRWPRSSRSRRAQPRVAASIPTDN